MSRTPAPAAARTGASPLADWLELTKARILGMALLAAAACMWLAELQAGAPLALSELLAMLLGLALVASASSVLNQVIEAPIDAQMRRTSHRPIPCGRVAPAHAVAYAVLAGVGGIAWLAWMVNPLTSVLALVMLAVYDFVYTPLKRITPLNTVVGAFPGAMPVLVGWAAAGHGLDFVAGMLFAILYLWQFPHFIAIAWIHRDDYRRAGLRMITVGDPEGRSSGRQAVQYALVLVPVSLLPSLAGGAGPVYFYGALALSVLFLACALRFGLAGSLPRARWLLRASIVYLPLLLALLVAETARAAIR